MQVSNANGATAGEASLRLTGESVMRADFPQQVGSADTISSGSPTPPTPSGAAPIPPVSDQRVIGTVSRSAGSVFLIPARPARTVRRHYYALDEVARSLGVPVEALAERVRARTLSVRMIRGQPYLYASQVARLRQVVEAMRALDSVDSPQDELNTELDEGRRDFRWPTRR